MSYPTAKYQPRGPFETYNFYVFRATKDLSPAELLEYHHPFGSKVYFSHPLQRRAEYQPCRDYFWYEPSGGLNAQLFEGIVVGVRNLSAGYQDKEERSYIPEAFFPAYLVVFSPYRTPLYVLPWHTWLVPEEYYEHRREAQRSWQRKEYVKHFA